MRQRHLRAQSEDKPIRRLPQLVPTVRAPLTFARAAPPIERASPPHGTPRPTSLLTVTKFHVTACAARLRHLGAHASRMLAPLARWPWPALWVWAAAWACLRGAHAIGLPGHWGVLLGTVCSLAGALAWPGLGRWRRGLLALGFPMALLMMGLGDVPAWAWLLPLAALLPLYPVQAWRDAPLFPTPHDALRGLSACLALPPQPRVLDAGCGTGDGLIALAREFPHARLEGVERSRPLAWLARRRQAGATVHTGDMWAGDWSHLDLVYLFQRPETMPRAWAKAGAEMAPGTFLASLEFPVPGVRAFAVLHADARRPVHIYRLPGHAAGHKTREAPSERPVSTPSAMDRHSRPGRPRR